MLEVKCSRFQPQGWRLIVVRGFVSSRGSAHYQSSVKVETLLDTCLLLHNTSDDMPRKFVKPESL